MLIFSFLIYIWGSERISSQKPLKCSNAFSCFQMILDNAFLDLDDCAPVVSYGWDKKCLEKTVVKSNIGIWQRLSCFENTAYEITTGYYNDWAKARKHSNTKLTWDLAMNELSWEQNNAKYHRDMTIWNIWKWSNGVENKALRNDRGLWQWFNCRKNTSIWSNQEIWRWLNCFESTYISNKQGVNLRFNCLESTTIPKNQGI